MAKLKILSEDNGSITRWEPYCKVNVSHKERDKKRNKLKNKGNMPHERTLVANDVTLAQ